jgi:hypothetical protein
LLEIYIGNDKTSTAQNPQSSNQGGNTGGASMTIGAFMGQSPSNPIGAQVSPSKAILL